MARFGLKGLFGRGIKKYLRVLHARKSSGQENNSNGHQKLETKIFFGPSSDFFSSEGKKIAKIYADLDGGLKNYESSIFDLQNTKKVVFFGNYPKKVFIFQI